MTADTQLLSDLRSALSDLGPDDLSVFLETTLTLRDRRAGGDRFARAVAAGFGVLAGIAADMRPGRRDMALLERAIR